MHNNSALLFKKYALPFFADHISVLEIGPAGVPTAYQQMVNNPTINWHTVDFADTRYIASSTSNLSYTLTDPYTFPIEDGLFDVVVSGQVIEHVKMIWKWIAEIKRVVKPGGRIITINPVSWPYHEAPVDCWRIFPEGIRALAEENDLLTEMALYESPECELILKKDPQSRIIPGMGTEHYDPDSLFEFQIKWNKIIRRVPYLGKRLQVPIEVAYDCFSVLKKNN